MLDKFIFIWQLSHRKISIDVICDFLVDKIWWINIRIMTAIMTEKFTLVDIRGIFYSDHN